MNATDRPLSAIMQAALLGALIEGEALNEPPVLRWLHAGGTRRTPPQTQAALIARGMAVANGTGAPPLTPKGIAEAERIRAARRADAARHRSAPGGADTTPPEAYAFTCPRCGADTGAACTGQHTHPERIAAAQECGQRFVSGRTCAEPVGHAGACRSAPRQEKRHRTQPGPGECGRRFVSGRPCRKPTQHTGACDPAPREGQVIAHQGHGQGLTPAHAQDPAAVRAARALAAAGLHLADLHDGYDPETCTATGYMVTPQGTDTDGDPWVYVYYLTDGRTYDPATDQHPRARLRDASDALRADGWAVDPLPGACVRAHLTGPAAPVPQHDRSAVTEIVTRVNARTTTG